MDVMTKIRKYGLLIAEELPRANREVSQMTSAQAQTAIKEYGAFDYASLARQIAGHRANIRMEELA